MGLTVAEAGAGVAVTREGVALVTLVALVALVAPLAGRAFAASPSTDAGLRFVAC